jgi:hypothetical protein
MVAPPQVGPRTSLPHEGYSDTQSLNQRDPTTAEKLWKQSLDVLDSLGPYTQRLSSLLRYSKEAAEQTTIQNMRDLEAQFEHVFGKDRVLRRVPAAQLQGTVPQKLAVLLNRSSADYGLTPKENDALVALLNAGLDATNLSEKAKATLPVDDPRLKAFAESYWRIATGRLSAHPVTRTMTVRDYLTGEEYPVGTPTPYWPHQALKREALEKLSDTTLAQVWRLGRFEEKGISLPAFKRMLPTLFDNTDPDFRLRRYAGLEHKRYLTAELLVQEANTKGMTEAEVLRELGYETDVLRMPVRHNYYGFKRVFTKEHEAELQQIATQLDAEYPPGTPTGKWIRTIVNRSQGLSPREDLIEHANNPRALAQAILYPALLKASWRQNLMLQPNYIAIQTGLKPLVTAYWKYLGGKLGWSQDTILEHATRSGATFPAFLTDYHLPEGLWDQYAKTASQFNAFHPSDVASRQIGAIASGLHVRAIAREFWKDPANPAWKKSLQEYHLNPQEVYNALAQQDLTTTVDRIPVLPDPFLLRAMQVGANRTLGRTGVEYLPAWAAGDSEAHHLLLMLRRQIVSNESALVDMVVNAPSARVGLRRVLTALVGAEAAGLMYNGVSNWILGNHFFDVNESMAHAFGGRKEAALAAKALLLGLGTFTSGLALTGLNALGGNAYGGIAYTFATPAISGVIDEGINALLQGRLSEFLVRLQPFETIQDWYRREQNQERQRRRIPTHLPKPHLIP